MAVADCHLLLARRRKDKGRGRRAHPSLPPRAHPSSLSVPGRKQNPNPRPTGRRRARSLRASPCSVGHLWSSAVRPSSSSPKLASREASSPANSAVDLHLGRRPPSHAAGEFATAAPPRLHQRLPLVTVSFPASSACPNPLWLRLPTRATFRRRKLPPPAKLRQPSGSGAAPYTSASTSSTLLSTLFPPISCKFPNCSQVWRFQCTDGIGRAHV